jgi:hypothetical protein
MAADIPDPNSPAEVDYKIRCQLTERDTALKRIVEEWQRIERCDAKIGELLDLRNTLTAWARP